VEIDFSISGVVLTMWVFEFPAYVVSVVEVVRAAVEAGNG
jgi:hypothetical protein